MYPDTFTIMLFWLPLPQYWPFGSAPHDPAREEVNVLVPPEVATLREFAEASNVKEVIDDVQLFDVIILKKIFPPMFSIPAPSFKQVANCVPTVPDPLKPKSIMSTRYVATMP